MISRKTKHRLSAILTCAVISQTVFSQSVIHNASLSSDGTLHGSAVGASGSAVPNSPVQVRFQGQVIATAMTSNTGQFAITNVRPGVHEVVVAGQSQPVRIWNQTTAPPSSASGVVVRCGQCGPVPMAMPSNSYVAPTPMQTMPMGQCCPPQGPCVPAQPCGEAACGAADAGFGWNQMLLGTSTAVSIVALATALKANNESQDATAVAAVANTNATTALTAGGTFGDSVASP